MPPAAHEEIIGPIQYTVFHGPGQAGDANPLESVLVAPYNGLGADLLFWKGGVCMSILFVVVSIAGGILFGVMDGIINANPLAVQLYSVYKPLARGSVNVPAGILIDLIYGFLLAGIFLMLYHSLPGGTGVLKGVSYALIVWFFRVMMAAASQWMMFDIPPATVLYAAAAGLVEMLVLGIFYGLLLKPAT